MQCTVCGQDYGLTHACPGIAPIIPADETGPSPALRFAPLHYLSEAAKILSWDDAAVRRASRDNNSLLYGLIIVAIAAALPVGGLLLRNAALGYPAPWNLIIWRYAQTLTYSLVWIFAQIGLSHAFAKAFFNAKGTYVQIMRAYLLGQMFRWLVLVPIVGPMAVGVGGIAVLMLVFEEVDGVERMKAFGLAAAIGVGFFILSIWLGTNGTQPSR